VRYTCCAALRYCQRQLQAAIWEKYENCPPEKRPELTREALQMVQQWIADSLQKNQLLR